MVLHYTSVQFIALHYRCIIVAFCCITLLSNVLHCSCIALNHSCIDLYHSWLVLHYTSVQFIALRYITVVLHCVILHTMQYNYDAMQCNDDAMQSNNVV